MPRQTTRKSYPGLPGPAEIIYDPVESDIADPAVRQLFARWASIIATTGHRPGHEIVETPEMAPLLRNVMLLEIIRLQPFGLDYLYRIYGPGIVEHYGSDMTGRRTSEFPSGVASFFAELYETAINRSQVIFSVHSPPMNINVKKWERLILPLGEPDVKWLLVVMLARGKRR